MQVSNGVIPLPVARFAREKVLPHVQRMDETSAMDKSIIDGLFEQGVRLRGTGQEERGQVHCSHGYPLCSGVLEDWF